MLVPVPAQRYSERAQFTQASGPSFGYIFAYSEGGGNL